MANDVLLDAIEFSIKHHTGERFKALEASVADMLRKMVDALPKPKDGDPGKNADEEAIASRVLGKVMKALDEIPKPEDGKDADPKMVAEMVAAEVAKLPKPQDGKNADPLLVQALVGSEVIEAVGKIRVPEDGKSVDPITVRSMVDAEVAARMASIKVPQDGKDFDPLVLKDEVARAMTLALELIPKGRDGKDADPEAIKVAAAEILPGMVDKAEGEILSRLADLHRELCAATEARVAAIPKPRDGIDGKDYDPIVLRAEAMTAARAAVAELPPAPAGKDANQVEIADAVYERLMKSIRMPADGKSVTVEDIKPLLEGEVSRWELEFERRAADVLQRAVDRMPRPKDGLGFDDMTVEEVDERTLAFVFTRGDQTKRFQKSWPVVIDRGTFKMGDSYQRGDAITYGGSLFIAQRDTLPTEKPEDGSGAFRLAVKRGRDGGSS